MKGYVSITMFSWYVTLVCLYLDKYSCSLWNYIEIVCDYCSIQFVVLSNKQ